MTISATLPPSLSAGTRGRRVLSWLFYGGLLLLMAAILTTLLGRLLPAELARRIGFNSEGYTLAVVLAGWIQFVLPKLTRATRWQVTLVVAAACLALALAYKPARCRASSRPSTRRSSPCR